MVTDELADAIADRVLAKLQPIAPQFMTAEQVVEFLGGDVSVRTLSNWRTTKVKGGPAWTVFGMTVLYNRDDVLAWARKNRRVNK